MASSNADADIKLKATLDAGEVQSELQKIGQDASTSLDAATRSADNLSNSMSKVGEKAKISGDQIASVTAALAGMGLQLAGSVLESRGHDTSAQYLKGAGAGAIQGLTAGAMVGSAVPGIGTAIGAAGGALIGGAAGAGGAFFNLRGEERKREEALAELGTSNAAALSKFDELRAASQESQDFYTRLADATLTASEQQAMLTDRMSTFSDAADVLRASLDTEALQRDGKAFAETMRDYNSALREVDAASKAAASIKDAAPTAKAGGGVIGYFDALQRMGITAGGGSGVMNTLATLQERANDHLQFIADEMHKFNEHNFGWS